MSSKEFRQLAREVINKEKWWDMLSRFIEVLRINIFVVDNRGLVILPPEERRYGGRLLTDKALKFDLLSDSIDVDRQFEPYGMFFESCNYYNLSSFAIPIKIEGGGKPWLSWSLDRSFSISVYRVLTMRQWQKNIDVI